MVITRNPLTLNPIDIDTIVAHKWPQLDNDYQYPSVAPEQFDAIEYFARLSLDDIEALSEDKIDIAIKKSYYHTPMDVVKALEKVENDLTLTPDAKNKQISDIYNYMALEVVGNRDSMLLIASYRPDAVLWAPEWMVDREFAKEAIKYNPMTAYTMPQDLVSQPSVIEAYEKAVFGNGYERHPGLKDIEIPFENNNNLMVSPNALRAMCNLTDYQKAVRSVFAHLDKQAITIDGDRQLVTATSPASYIALCEKELPVVHFDDPANGPDYVIPDVIDRMNALKIQEYEKGVESQQLQKAALTNSVVRERLAEFCFAYDLSPEPQWMSEYMKIQEADRAAAMHTLYELGHQLSWEQDNARRGQQSSAYPQQFVQTVSDLQTKLSLDVVKQQINLPEFWQDVGVAMSEAHSRAKSNQYPENSQHSFESDRAFFVGTRQLARTHQDSAFIKENIQLGINEERKRNISHEREER